MNKRILSVLSILLSMHCFGQQNSFTDPVSGICELCKVDIAALKENSPSIPLLKFSGNFNSNEQFIAEYKKWIHTNPEQYSYLKDRCTQSGNNISWISMGIEDAIEPFLPDSVRHGYTYFVYKVLKMDFKRVNALAPHLPVFQSTGKFKIDSLNYDEKYKSWSRSYHREVERIYNSDENRKLIGAEFEWLSLGASPDSLPSSRTQEDNNKTEQSNILGEYTPELPGFLYVELLTERPIATDETIDINKIQKWLWINDTLGYINKFTVMPQLPVIFNSSKFRIDAINKLNPNPDGYFYIVGNSGEIRGEAFDFHHSMGHPDFMYEEITDQRPAGMDTQQNLLGKSVHEIHSIKKWLYFFEPTTYVLWFGEYPAMPNGFKTDQYKADLINGLISNPDADKYFTH